MKHTGKFVNCPFCNKSFYVVPHRAKNAKVVYCSQRCHYKHKFMRTLKRVTEQYPESWQELIYKWYITEEIPVRQITKRLGLSNRVIPRALKLLNIPQRSPHDRIVLQWKDNEEKKREQCKRMRMSKLLKGNPPWNKGLTKETHPSINKQATWMIGKNNPMYGIESKNHPQYKNGKYTADKKRYWGTSEYRQWRKAVFKRDEHTCQECGYNKGRIINAHHIKPVKDYPELVFDVSNGITLCEKCHIFVHSYTPTSSTPREQRHKLCKGGVLVVS